MILTQHGIDSIRRYPIYVDGPTIGGRKYKAVKTGNQLWMAENLDLNIEGSLYYSDSSFYDGKCGRLYNYQEMQEVKNYIPLGWRIPTYNDWDILAEFAGGVGVAGKNLKSKIDNGDDIFGVSLICGGNITPWGNRYDGGSIGFYFTDTLYDSTSVYYRAILKSLDFITQNERNIFGYRRSIRLVKDAT